MHHPASRHIVLVGPAPPYRGGIAHFTEATARGLEARGHRVEVVTFSRQYPELLFPGKTQYAPGAASGAHVPPASAGAGSAHVLLVGDALFGEEARYAEALRRQVRRLGLAGRVHFLGFRDDVPQLMRAVDVVAHTSTAPEPFGRVIVEGMLAGRPVVATKAGGALEIVEDGATGLLVPPDAPHVLGEALQQLLTCPDLAARLARDGRAAARRRFSMQQMLGGVAQQIHHVLLQ